MAGNASYIYQTAEIQTADDFQRWRMRDNLDRHWRGWQNGIIGINRVITVHDQQDVEMARRSRDQWHGTIGPRSNRRLNSWMESQTNRLLRRYGDEQTRVIGHFASRQALEQAGKRVVFLGGFMPVDFIGIYFNAARTMREAGLGQYWVGIDTDRPGEVDRVFFVGVGEGDNESHLWDNFYTVVGDGISSYNKLRERAASYRHSFDAAKLAIRTTTQQLQPHSV